jgi:hypothetical protein
MDGWMDRGRERNASRNRRMSHDSSTLDSCVTLGRYLAAHTWKYRGVDEGHRLKNKDCRLLRDLKSLKGARPVPQRAYPAHNFPRVARLAAQGRALHDSLSLAALYFLCLLRAHVRVSDWVWCTLGALLSCPHTEVLCLHFWSSLAISLPRARSKHATRD